MRKIVLFIFLLVSSNIGYSQSNRTDSLKIEMDRYSKKDTIKINKILDYTESKGIADDDNQILLLKETLVLAKKLNYAKGQIDILFELARRASVQNLRADVISYELEALKIAEDAGLIESQIRIHNQLSGAYRLFANESLRIFHLKKSLDLATSIQNQKLIKSVLISLGDYYSSKNEFERADSVFNKALQMEKGQEDDLLKRSVLKSSIRKLVTQKDFKGAISIQKQLLNEFKKINSKTNEAFSYAQLSFGYSMIKVKDSAYFYANKGLAFSKEHFLEKEIMDSYNALFFAYQQFGEYKKALEYRLIYDSLYYKTFNPESARSVEQTRMQYAQEKKDALYKIEELKKETEAERIRNLQFTIIGFFVLLAVFLFWTNRQKQKANKVLQRQRDEINDQRQKLQVSLETLKSTQAQLIQSEKMASLGELTAGIAHEIQNPLNFVNNFSEVSNELISELKVERLKVESERDKVLEDELLNDIAQNLTKINHHGKRASDIVKGMLEHSRKSTGEKEATDINALCDEYLRLAYHGLKAKDNSFNATMETHFDPNLPKIDIIPQDIGRVILNLINNAFYVVNERSKKGESDYVPTVSISTLLIANSANTQLTANTQLLIAIKDNGSGIPNSIKEKIFQPFFTTKPTGQGTGLGLSLAYDIVKAHGGTIKIQSNENAGMPAEQAGTEFTIQLPT